MAASDVTVEVDGQQLALTNLDKPLYPDGTTKAEVIHYYQAIAPTLLPHLAGRCITRQRFPSGTDAPGFYEKNLPAGVPDWIASQTVVGSNETVRYVVASDIATLVWLANLAALELHTPQWRILDQPGDHSTIKVDAPMSPLVTTAVIDLDPGTGVEMAQTAEAAMIIGTLLMDLGLTVVPKTSGSKGLQLFIPIVATPWGEAEAFVKALADHLAASAPDRFVISMNKELRAGRIYVDFMQNRAARNTASVYTLRARKTPTVSTPVTWDEVGAASTGEPLSFVANEVLDRIQTHGDLFADVLDADLASALPDLGQGT